MHFKYLLIKSFLGILALLQLMSCTSKITKVAAFPNMYQSPPLSILVLPPINETTAADASDYYVTTIAGPVAARGYYVLPIEVVFDLLKQEGFYDSKAMLSVPVGKFKEYFGADAVMFIRILNWDKSYYVIGGNVTVSFDFQLISTTTNEILWQYNGTIVLDTSGSNGGNNGLAGLAAALISTAINTAATRYVMVAKMANNQALNSIPFGKYHPFYTQDGDDNVVDESTVKKANIRGGQ
jgi:hypothetical protein